MAGYINNSTDQAIFESYSQGRAQAGAVFPQIVGGQWSAVLDAATCDFCGWADERTFAEGGQPWDPPVHYGCRCLVGWITKEEFPPETDWKEGPPSFTFPPGNIDKTKGAADRAKGKIAKPVSEDIDADEGD